MSVFKGVLSFVVVLTSLSYLCLLSCERGSSNKSATKDKIEDAFDEDIVSAEKRSPGFKVYYLNGEERFIYYNLPKGDLENRPKEEEIKYFFPKGYYRLDRDSLDYWNLSEVDSDKDYDDEYSYLVSNRHLIEDGTNIIDAKGNILSVLDIRNMFEKVELFEDEELYRTKTNLKGYQAVDEIYGEQRGDSTYYCKEIRPEAVPEDLIFDDNLRIRLYTKDNKIIDEYKMRNEVNIEDYKRDPKRYQNKMPAYSNASAWLIGMLKLPPKDQREGLKYRVLRLDENGKPKPYLYQWAYKYPFRYYMNEYNLPPYFEYKHWTYLSSSGCYALIPFTGRVGDPR